MAVTITQQPNAITTVRPSLEWWLTQTVAPAANHELYLYYRINVNSSFVMSSQRVLRYSQHTAKLDFSNIVLAALECPIKALDDTTAAHQPESVADCYIEYGEWDVDLDTGNQVQSGPFNTGPIRAIFGGFSPNQGDPVIGTSAPILLTNKPTRFKLARNQADWIYFSGNTSGASQAQIIGYDSAGATVFATSVKSVSAGEYVGFPVGGANAFEQAGGIPSNVCYLEVEIATLLGFANSTTYRIDIYDCDDQPEAELYFREPKGGWASIRFDRVDYGVSRTANTFSQYYDKRGTIADRLGVGGSAVIGASGRQSFTLVKKLNQESLQLADYYAGLFATKEHYIRRLAADGSYQAERVIITSGDSTVAKYGGSIEFSVSCQLAKNTNEI